ncbi:MAG: restriction endonuclease subunit S [Scytolyngbya sp. HA4215-MV1]|nr:restriction endonuclease subunit S [Scytolyngbya sp. HA4215-MV1]
MVVKCFPEAPDEWLHCAIHAVAEVSPRYQLDKDKEYPFVPMSCVAENFGGITGFESRKPDSSGYASFKLNDILYGKITPCVENGKVALVIELPYEYGLGSTEFIVLSPRENNDPKYLFELVCSNPVHGRVVSRMEGSTGRLRVTEDTFTKWLQVAVPTYEEQKKIAYYFHSIDIAIARTRDEISATQQLKKSLMQQLFTRGIPGRHQKFSSLRIVQRRVIDIPVDWEATKLGSCISKIQYGTNEPSNDYGGGYPVIAIPQVVSPRLELKDTPFAALGQREADDLRLQQGDVLLIRTNGNPDYLAKSTVVSEEVAAQHVVYASYLIRVRTDSERLLGEYLNYFLASPLGRRQALAMANTSAGNNNISTRSLKQFWLPRPEIAEQEEIIEILNNLEDTIDATQGVLNQQIRLKRSLLQNLLTGKIRVNLEATS